ncbi:uncharacterized protein LOC112690813 [Sipha flava]|uniref:Uncharacterized protein LOC112690813 n=1 Tax=Sipha flava TaxID=143950 RepID=A0A8B8GBW0_9HEMI|nr:uncharacterized protein LOC112690813 [Sipha flava]
MAMFRSSSSLHAVFVYLLLVHIVRSLHNVSIHFIPPAVERGQNVMLYCNYDLDGAPMLSVKWYRGSHEFYRYSPGMIPTTQTFPFHGLNVDLSVSNATQVFLRDVGFNLSGNLSCEVTTDGPSFKIASASKRIIVVGKYNSNAHNLAVKFEIYPRYKAETFNLMLWGVELKEKTYLNNEPLSELSDEDFIDNDEDVIDFNALYSTPIHFTNFQNRKQELKKYLRKPRSASNEDILK